MLLQLQFREQPPGELGKMQISGPDRQTYNSYKEEPQPLNFNKFSSWV